MDNPEPENNESRNRKIKNALVSGTFKPGSTEDLKLMANLFVRTGQAAGTIIKYFFHKFSRAFDH